MRLEIPASALPTPTVISVHREPASAFPELANYDVYGDVYVFEPNGLHFASPARISFDRPAGTPDTAVAFWSSATSTTEFAPLDTAPGVPLGGVVEHFSLGYLAEQVGHLCRDIGVGTSVGAACCLGQCAWPELECVGGTCQAAMCTTGYECCSRHRCRNFDVCGDDNVCHTPPSDECARCSDTQTCATCNGVAACLEPGENCCRFVTCAPNTTNRCDAMTGEVLNLVDSCNPASGQCEPTVVGRYSCPLGRECNGGTCVTPPCGEPGEPCCPRGSGCNGGGTTTVTCDVTDPHNEIYSQPVCDGVTNRCTISVYTMPCSPGFTCEGTPPSAGCVDTANLAGNWVLTCDSEPHWGGGTTRGFTATFTITSPYPTTVVASTGTAPSIYEIYFNLDPVAGVMWNVFCGGEGGLRDVIDLRTSTVVQYTTSGACMPANIQTINGESCCNEYRRSCRVARVP